MPRYQILPRIHVAHQHSEVEPYIRAPFSQNQTYENKNSEYLITI